METDKTVVAFITVGKNGKDEILGFTSPATGAWISLVGEEETIKYFYVIAQGISKATGKPFRAFRFPGREDITEECDKYYNVFGKPIR